MAFVNDYLSMAADRLRNALASDSENRENEVAIAQVEALLAIAQRLDALTNRPTAGRPFFRWRGTGVSPGA